jgi:hypothetical protein
MFGSYKGLLDSLPSPTAKNLVVDLAPLRWIEALSIAVLVAFMKRHLHSHPETENYIEYPRRYQFLQRMDFFRAIGADVPEEFQRQDEAGRFVPVREVDDSAGVPEAAEDIVQTLRIDDLDAARTLRHCIGEIVDNVFVHARSDVHAVICAQHFPNACRSQVGIVDTGIGLRQSFVESPAFSKIRLNDRAAVELAVMPYVTSKPQTMVPYENSYGRLGVGLFIVSEVLDRVGGRLLLISGRSAVDRRNGRKYWQAVKPWRGTIVGFEVPDEPVVSYEDALREARRMARSKGRSPERE